ncbi:MAG: hypothetical protein VZR73_18110 [Acutalibacteraceae bacterium]|nr:hypothetical protein [Acutalibacteraceae bacterium]
MYNEHIQMINDWFEKHNDYGTYHTDDEYAVRIGDMREFGDLIAEIPDLIYFPCDFGKEGIFFTTEDLNKARYY